MRLLITGADGFVGRNLTARLNCLGYNDILPIDLGASADTLDEYARECDFVFHLAGVNRPDDPEDFSRGNVDASALLLEHLKKHGNKAPVLFASSVQAEADNPYGRSKKAAEGLLLRYGEETGAKVLIYRLTNVFGKWCRPNYNSVVATFCHNIARDLPIRIDDSEKEVRLVYIDDVASEFISAMEGSPNKRDGFYRAEPVYEVTLGYLAGLLQSFRDSRESLSLPDTSDPFASKLYATYISYLPEDGLSYPLNPHTDARGFFAEFIRTPERGQYSVNVSKPGVVKGNHWHHTKNEKFLVVSGSGIIRLRRLNGTEITEYRVSGKVPTVVDVPPGYVHSIVNTGDGDMVALLWASECFDPANHDTWPMEVDV